MEHAAPETEFTAERVYFKRKIFIGNISFRVKPAQLEHFLSKFGEVTNVHIINVNAKHMSKRIGFATFASAEMASKAKMAKPEDLQLNGREIRIHPAEKMRSKKKLQHAPLEFLNKDDFSASAGINILNDYVLMRILSYLDIEELLAVENVCKRWKATVDSILASCHSLKFSKDFPPFSSFVLDDALLKMVLLRSPNLRALDLKDTAHSLTPRTSEIISELCRDLGTLKLYGVGITDDGLQLISENFPNLKSVCLQSCDEIKEEGLEHLTKNCQSLEYFEVRHINFAGECFEYLSPNLKGLVVYSCIQFRDWHRIPSKLKNLRTLTLKYVTRTMTDSQLKDILENCIYIENLELHEVHNMNRIIMLILAPSEEDRPSIFIHVANLSHLKCLKVFGMHNAVNDEVLIALSTNCQALVTLDLTMCHYVTDKGVDSLKLLPNLKHLTLDFIQRLTPSPLKAIAARGQLATLSMKTCTIKDISGPVEVLKLCPNMVELNIVYNTSVTTKMVMECINAVEGRERNHELTIFCAGCSVKKKGLSFPPYVHINWHDFNHDYDLLDDYDSYDSTDDPNIIPLLEFMEEHRGCHCHPND